jgi:hypothetical protein
MRTNLLPHRLVVSDHDHSVALVLQFHLRAELHILSEDLVVIGDGRGAIPVSKRSVAGGGRREEGTSRRGGAGYAPPVGSLAIPSRDRG